MPAEDVVHGSLVAQSAHGVAENVFGGLPVPLEAGVDVGAPHCAVAGLPPVQGVPGLGRVVSVAPCLRPVVSGSPPVGVGVPVGVRIVWRVAVVPAQVPEVVVVVVSHIIFVDPLPQSGYVLRNKIIFLTTLSHPLFKLCLASYTGFLQE
jgi:hypothetical protein